MSEKTLTEIQEEILNMSDDAAQHLMLSSPWQSGVSSEVDADGAPVRSAVDDDGGKDNLSRSDLQRECWNKYHNNPQVNTSVRGLVGRLCGRGFSITSPVLEIQEVVDEIVNDPRNRLYEFFNKYLTRLYIEGELFLCFTIHKDGFIEVDFMDPSAFQSSESDGVICHRSKPNIPLVYVLKDGKDNEHQIPSIYLARYPEYINFIDSNDFSQKLLNRNKSRAKTYQGTNGYTKVIVQWNRGIMTKRSSSYLRTTLEWLNHYENLKKYEIDHKKSSGAYLWQVNFEDIRAWKIWMAMTDEQKSSTGVMAKKTPGSTILMPPGMKMVASNPNLPKISEGDTDILHMITSGLNEPEDVATGQSKGTFASVKESRGPMSDRISDEVEFFEKYLRFDFWKTIFWIKSAITDFPSTFSNEEVVDFKNQKPIKKQVKRVPESEELLEITFPISETIDVEGRAKGFLGVKHGSTNFVLGFPNSLIAKKLGVGNYRKQRLINETELIKYPELIPEEDQESVQEESEGGEASTANKKVDKSPKKKLVKKKE